ncbi:MAG TPA: TIR domain-containing protein [Sphingomicrobium sp.]|nr:TIR domain-containing protein [Sphingomicrobium sp.]
MNEITPATPGQSGLSRSVFISYATKDRKQALSVCKAIESRGTKCWVSMRDVEPGENYQEAIVHSIRNARAMVLVFSEAANHSDEIKKELSLASRHHVPVMALRIADVEPSDAFAYELSTRQWIDAFDGWDRSIDALVGRIERISGTKPVTNTTAGRTARHRSLLSRRRIWIAATAGLLLLVMAAGAWWMLWPTKAVAHSMTVRLAGFQLLSPDLPARMHDTVGSEIIAAFNADGVIGVSTTSAPPTGTAPTYALGGTIHRVGDSIRVITQFTNERTGAILWSDSVDYAADQVSNIPHKIAVDAGTVIRCGLFGASTYRKSLPDAVLGNYMQYCQEYWDYGGSKTLRFAQLVVAAVPDFSWGWSGVANGFLQASFEEPDNRRVEELRAAGRQAEDKALALDRNNSEALAHKAYLIDPHDWASQESLFKSAIAAKPLDCGCEHYGYGLMLENVGRLDDAIEQYRAATDMLALWPDSQRSLASALVAADRVEEAIPHFDEAIRLSKDPTLDQWIAVTEGTETGDYAAALTPLRDPRYQMSEARRAARLSGYEALASGDPKAKSKAVQMLLALPKKEQGNWVATMLAALGANREALQAASQTPALFWHRSMRGVLNDPGFPAVAKQLGLMAYWKNSHTKPDVCLTQGAPPFCRSI